LDEDRFVEGGEFHTNCYYRFASTNISAFLLARPPDGSAPLLLIFRTALGTEAHNIGEESLCVIDNLGLSPDTRGCYVVVTPKRIKVEVKLPMVYFGKRGRSKLSDNILWVFNYPVPVGVLFPGFRA